MKNKCDFTFRHYEEILKTAKQKGFKFAFFQKKKSFKRTIYLRHDIDVSLENALKIAEIERKYKVYSTFFIRTHTSFYNPISLDSLEIIKEIVNLGHKIGLHYDGFVKKNLEEIIKKEFNYLRKYLPINKVVSFHHPNQKIFGLELKGFMNTYNSYFFKRCEYISDSNRELKKGCIKKFVEQTNCQRIQILTHPLWWNKKELSYSDLYQNLKKQKERNIKIGLRLNISAYKTLFKNL